MKFLCDFIVFWSLPIYILQTNEKLSTPFHFYVTFNSYFSLVEMCLIFFLTVVVLSVLALLFDVLLFLLLLSVCRYTLRTFWVSEFYLSKLPTRFKFKGNFYQQKMLNKKQNNNENQEETLHGCLCVWGCLYVCVRNEMISWEWVDENMKNIKLRGTKKEMLLLVDQNTKRIFFFVCSGLGKGMWPRECRVRVSGWDIHRDGRLMRVCVSVCVGVGVDEMKVSLLVNIMT